MATVSADLLRLLVSYAKACGLEVSIEPADREARVEMAAYRAAFDAVLAASGDEDFGLHLGEAASRVGGGHVLAAVMVSSPTVGAALEHLARYHGLVTAAVTPVLLDDVIVLEPHAPLGRHEAEAMLATFASVLGVITGGAVRPRAVGFAHPRPARTAEHERIFGCPVSFDRPRSELSLHESDLARPMPMADAPLLDTLARFAEQRLASTAEPWSSRVRDAVTARRGRLGLAEAAKAMAVSPRTLQSRLDEEGTSFKQILDDVRKELALGYLERDDLSLSEIAFLLGYSEQSAFSHAFRRWTGHSPSEHKRSRD